MEDLSWIDTQQKARENRQRLGFLFESALIGKIEKKQVLVAEATDGLGVEGRRSEQAASDSQVQHDRLDPPPAALDASRQRVVYLIAQDRYLKRDDLGLVVQICVLPAYRRSLVAAHLLQAQFDRSAYGCKLYCCWCAQDLEANRFWEAMGFVPLAFRTGSPREKVKRPDGSKGPRIHIFWQKRIRLGDGEPGDASGGTPYWYPSETSGGAIGASRIVLSIPLGTHWSEAKPAVLPAELLALPPAPEVEPVSEAGEERVAEEAETRRRRGKPKQEEAARGADEESGVKAAAGVNGFGVGFGPSPEALTQRAAEQAAIAAEARAADAEAKRKKAAKRKAERARLKTNDPALCAYSRELRDRWAEATAPGTEGARLLAAAEAPRFDVARSLGVDEARASVFLDAASEGMDALAQTGLSADKNVKHLAA
ncbi:MAG: hypothetical protein AAGH92_07700 [Planctomycetota bacterium]